MILTEDVNAGRMTSGNHRRSRHAFAKEQCNMKTVVLVGTLDTKGLEYGYLRDRLRLAGVEALVVDTGILGTAAIPADVSRDEVAKAAGTSVDALIQRHDRGAAVTAMGEGAAVVVRRLYESGKCDGILAAGGTGNTALTTRAMRALPVGVPKLIVSTVAAGDTRDYVGATDLTMMASVVDVAGINSISANILANAAAAIAGMVSAPPITFSASKPLVAATMFGVTTPCVNAARAELEKRGYEVLVFHATGTGGRAMEGLVESGFVRGVLDITTTELADELVGGVFSAGPTRLEIAGRLGIPQVVSLGALDMVNFGSKDAVPAQFKDRTLHVHNASVTLMRTTPDECATLGRQIANKLSSAKGRVALYVPLKGVSAIDVAGAPFYDADANQALFASIRKHISQNVELHELDMHINDPAFAEAMADKFDTYVKASA
jgi:uncharacterized protein (UPF0261 family)